MSPMNDDSITLPAGTKTVAAPKFALESFVTSADDAVPGEVVIAVTGTFYLVAFEDEGEYEWYPESALTSANVTESAVQEAAEKARLSGNLTDMAAYSKLKTMLPK